MSTRAACFVSGIVILAGAAARAAGPVDPPAGPVVSTMKPLTDVEPRTALNATNTPGDSDSMFRITKPGSYYLTGDLAVAPGKRGIEIDADNVTLDLSGFTISGGERGVTSGAKRSMIEVRNGAFADGGAAIFFDEALGVRITVRDVRVSGMSTTGIRLPESSEVLGCRLYDIAGTGIIMGGDGVVRDTEIGLAAGGIIAGSGAQLSHCRTISVDTKGFILDAGSIVESCTALSSGSDGFDVGGFGSRLTGCTAAANSGRGFVLSHENQLEGCIADRNGSAGIQAGEASVVRSCTARHNGTQGIVIGTNSVLTDSYATLNGASGNYTGIWVNGNDCRVENNHSTGNDFGFYTQGTNNVIVRNTARGNTTNFDVGAGNDLAPVVVNPGGSGFSTATPWSNFAY
ncbi:MAG TPA: right-handed parallel beta-helix repeat-containing protein [Phycisphaerales bacterium]|nr:right-handed parallel beta-helix repeat-containing protein [Phycisphaerales bacterium]